MIPTVTASTQKQIEPGLEPSKEPPAGRQVSGSENTTPPVKPAAKVAGIDEITRTSRVYAAPSELSQLIGDIEPGIKVSVVNSRDGWLEIPSKHGRPPGFIRRDVAARVADQN